MVEKNKKHITKVFIFVISLIVLAFSGTYAYFTIEFQGSPNTTTVKSGVFKVESSLEKASAIRNKRIVLIDEDQKQEKAEKLTFTVTSTEESTVNGEFDIFLKDITLSKNLYSNYLKWELLKNNEIISKGDFANAIRTDESTLGEEDNVVTTVEDMKLNKESLPLVKNTTTTYTFIMYLLNDKNKNQIALTEGSFSGRLYIEAVPVSEMAS